MSTPFTSAIEPLEARIAPAAVFTYIDVDGDIVTIKTSKGTDTQLIDILVRSSEGVANGEELQRVDFSLKPDVFAGTDLTVTAKRGLEGGDGLVNVGYIDATSTDGGTSIDLGNITISGDLGRIVAGDATTKTAGVKSLSVGTMGRYGTDTQSGVMPSLGSTITGGLGSFKSRGDVKGTSLIVTGGMTAADGKIGSLAIGGSLIGGDNSFSGFISATGGIGKLNVTHNIEGTGNGSGQIFTGARIESATIGGSIIAGGGNHSGRLQAGSFGKVLVKGSLVGASLSGVMTMNFAGAIESTAGAINGSITILGSILGGNDPGSGSVIIAGDLGSLTVGGNISSEGFRSGDVSVGGTLAKLNVRGSIFAGKFADHGADLQAGRFGDIVIGGDVRGGVDAPFSGHLQSSKVGSVSIGGSLVGGADSDLGTNGGNEGRASGSLDFLTTGSIKIRGSIVGGSGDYSGQVSINFGSVSVGGSLLGGPGKVSGVISSSGALGPVTIGGDIRGANAYGYDVLQSGAIVAKSLASVTVGGSIVAGQKVTANTLTQSGFIGAEDSIGSITVKGSLIGNAVNPVAIIARGQAVPGAAADLAIGSITVGGRVESTNIFAGYSLIFRGLNADAQIGKVSVGGDWVASNLLAGINPGGDSRYGTVDDIELLGGQDFGSGPVKDSNALTSKIASIVIKGGVFGTPGITTDTSGFGAQEIVSFKLGSVTLPLRSGVANDVFITSRAQPIGAGLTGANTGDGFEIHVFEV
ncbi:MAG: hypothetical protein WCF18_24840 [Chthoniobacteraceae bacterium]